MARSRKQPCIWNATVRSVSVVEVHGTANCINVFSFTQKCFCYEFLPLCPRCFCPILTKFGIYRQIFFFIEVCSINFHWNPSVWSRRRADITRCWRLCECAWNRRPVFSPVTEDRTFQSSASVELIYFQHFYDFFFFSGWFETLLIKLVFGDVVVCHSIGGYLFRSYCNFGRIRF